MTKIIEPRAEYTMEELTGSPLLKLFRKFEIGFRQYVGDRLGFVNQNEAPNFNRYKGDLERACHAAQTIGADYDVGIGLARKGMWLSYVFNLHGLPTFDVLVNRIGDEQRAMFPVSPLYTDTIRDKRVLLFDNDLVTGNSVKAVAENLQRGNPQSVDLLLVYGNTQLDPKFFDSIKESLKAPRIIGKTSEGKIVVNTRSEVPPSIVKARTLDEDFNTDRQHLEKLSQILGVKL